MVPATHAERLATETRTLLALLATSLVAVRELMVTLVKEGDGTMPELTCFQSFDPAKISSTEPELLEIVTVPAPSIV